VVTAEGSVGVAAVAPHRIVDPTGVGDAFRGGLMKGIALGLPYDACAKMGSVAATYALEHLGGQSHSYTWDEFKQRYQEHFGLLTIPA
jgi:adenosine kinase